MMVSINTGLCGLVAMSFCGCVHSTTGGLLEQPGGYEEDGGEGLLVMSRESAEREVDLYAAPVEMRFGGGGDERSAVAEFLKVLESRGAHIVRDINVVIDGTDGRAGVRCVTAFQPNEKRSVVRRPATGTANRDLIRGAARFGVDRGYSSFNQGEADRYGIPRGYSSFDQGEADRYGIPRGYSSSNQRRRGIGRVGGSAGLNSSQGDTGGTSTALVEVVEWSLKRGETTCRRADVSPGGAVSGVAYFNGPRGRVTMKSTSLMFGPARLSCDGCEELFEHPDETKRKCIATMAEVDQPGVARVQLGEMSAVRAATEHPLIASGSLSAFFDFEGNVVAGRVVVIRAGSVVVRRPSGDSVRLDLMSHSHALTVEGETVQPFESLVSEELDLVASECGAREGVGATDAKGEQLEIGSTGSAVVFGERYELDSMARVSAAETALRDRQGHLVSIELRTGGTVTGVLRRVQPMMMVVRREDGSSAYVRFLDAKAVEVVSAGK